MVTMNLSRQLARILPKNRQLYCTTPTNSQSNPPRNHLEHLKTRSLIKLDGPDASGLLQGLITNDIYQLPQETGKLSSLFAMFLNVKGRILCDSIIYTFDKDSYVVEADALIIEQLMRHLRMYKLKKQVDIKLLDSYKVFALYEPRDQWPDQKGLHSLESAENTQSSTANGRVLNDMYIFCDPRVPALGSRILAKDIVQSDDLSIAQVNTSADKSNYRWLRYNLGVAEGVVDIPSQVCFPLEHNCEFMNGLNLHKGCYLGQELTARTFHTGKVRKRIMPVFLKKELLQTPTEINLKGADQNSLGKLRGVHFNMGLALLRMHLVVDVEINVGDTQGVTKIPHWWSGSKSALQEKIADKTI